MDADKVGEGVDQEEAAAAELVSGRRMAAEKGIGQPALVGDLADHVLGVASDAQFGGACGVEQAVRDEFVDDEFDFAEPLRPEPAIPRPLQREGARRGEFRWWRRSWW
ncbi:hypothetical protein [Amycolatopsis sp. MEPSY49]|uniref:hypothetical protein n=1 Tax=Amycolatopsis sp. MEPSY49 TaxID=3151600 RepID=UPI003EFB3A47